MNAGKIFYTSACQTFICLEIKNISSVFKCSSACLAQKVMSVSGHC